MLVLYHSGLSGGECFIPLGQVNPLGLPIRPGIEEKSLDENQSHSTVPKNRTTSESTTYVVENSTGIHHNRFRRDQNYVVGHETYFKDNRNNSKAVKIVCN